MNTTTPWTPASDQPSPTAQALTAAHDTLDTAERTRWEAERAGAGVDVLADLDRQADTAAKTLLEAAAAHRAARNAWRIANGHGAL